MGPRRRREKPDEAREDGTTQEARKAKEARKAEGIGLWCERFRRFFSHVHPRLTFSMSRAGMPVNCFMGTCRAWPRPLEGRALTRISATAWRNEASLQLSRRGLWFWRQRNPCSPSFAFQPDSSETAVSRCPAFLACLRCSLSSHLLGSSHRR